MNWLWIGLTFIWFLTSISVFSTVDHDLPDHLQWLTRNNLHALIIHDSMDPAVNMRQCTDPALDNQGKNLNAWMIRFMASKAFLINSAF